jgi:hypothetical protein
MNFNYILSTGSVSIADSQVNILERNQESFPQEDYSTTQYLSLGADGALRNNLFHFDGAIVTGDNCSLLSLNSQTILEGEINITTGQNKYYYSVNGTGDYSVDFENSNGRIVFHSSINIENTDVLFYDKRDQSNPFVRNKVNVGGSTWYDEMQYLIADINAQDATASFQEMIEKYNVFLNGQKITDESSTTLDEVTGKLFAIKKNQLTQELIGISGETYGNPFIEHQVDFYINGMEQDHRDFLQTYTGVYTIETGVNNSIGLIQQETESYSL